MLRPIKEKSVIPGNGYCLINLIIKCMATDFNHKIKQQDLLDQIVDELMKCQMIYTFLSRYKKTNDQKSRIIHSRCLQSIHSKIVDIIVCATANVIGYNLAIFQNIGGQAIIIFTQCIDKIQVIHCTSSMTTVQVLIVLPLQCNSHKEK